MAAQVPKDFRRVIVAAAVGNVIEWYDFYIFGSLAAILSVKFFEKTHPVAALLSTIALFTAGFLIRPFGRIPVRLAGRPGRPQVHVPDHADRDGARHRRDRLDPELPVDRHHGRVPAVRPAHDPRPVPGRRIWRRHHLRRRARIGRTPRLLYRLAADLADAGIVVSMAGDRRHAGVPRHRSVQRLGLAHPVPGLVPAGRDRDLHPPATAGDADLPGDQGQGPDDQEPVARGVPQHAI